MADNEQPNNVQNFVDKLASGDNTGAGEAFKDALRGKVGAELDTQRKTYASSLFNAAADVMTGNTAPEAEGHSDPKPEVADPLTQNATQDEVQQAFSQTDSTDTKQGE